MTLLPGPTWIGRGIDVYIQLFPIDNAVGQRAGRHDIDHQCSMSPQALIEGFQVSHRSHATLSREQWLPLSLCISGTSGNSSAVLVLSKHLSGAQRN
jgi:hypothetical protein